MATLNPTLAMVLGFVSLKHMSKNREMLQKGPQDRIKILSVLFLYFDKSLCTSSYCPPWVCVP